MSKKHVDAATRYPTHEKELLAVHEALTLWEHYLGRSSFTVRVCTDHQPLQYVHTQPKMSGRVARWMETLSRFDFTVVYLPGKANLVADALSRPRRSWLAAVRQARESVEGEGEMGRTGVTNGFMAELLKAVDADPWYTKMRRDVALGLQPLFSASDDFLYRAPEPGRLQLVVPVAPGIKRDLLHEAHDMMAAGHLGIEKTYRRILQHFWWPRIYEDTREYVSSCPTCQASKPSNAKTPGLIQPLSIPSQPWESVSLDIMCGLPTTRAPDKFDALAVFVCRFTKMVRLAPMRLATKAPEFAKIFVNTMFRSHGLPRELVSDRDSRFVSRFWTALFAALGTKLCKSSAYHPQTDGQMERANRTVAQVLRTIVSQKQSNWAEALPMVEFSINSAVHAGAKFSPFFLNYGYDPHVPASLLDERRLKSRNPSVQGRLEALRAALKAAKRNLLLAQGRMVTKVDAKRHEVSYNVGDRVLWTSQQRWRPMTGEGKAFMCSRGRAT